MSHDINFICSLNLNSFCLIFKSLRVLGSGCFPALLRGFPDLLFHGLDTKFHPLSASFLSAKVLTPAVGVLCHRFARQHPPKNGPRNHRKIFYVHVAECLTASVTIGHAPAVAET